MNKKSSKKKATEEIDLFFYHLRDKSPEEIKKIKSLAMNKKISLKKHRKFFCKNCLTSFSEDEKIRIKKGIKSVECKNCGFVNRWKIK